MQTRPTNYINIVEGEGEHWFETRVKFGSNTVNESQIFSLERSMPGMASNRPCVGAALSSTLSLKIVNPSFTVGRMAQINVEIRAKNASSSSSWIPAGTYYTDTRSVTEADGGIKLLNITAFDIMAKAEADYPDTEHDWPYRDRLVVDEIVKTVFGVTSASSVEDSSIGTYITAGYMVDLPISYTMREVLANIAASYGGNFVITAENKLKFIPLFGFDESQFTGFYLADENGNALTFGNEGWCILV